MAFISAVPFTSSVRATSFSHCAVRPAFTTSSGVRKALAPRVSTVAVPRMEFEISEGVEYNLSPAIILIAFFGWVIPSSIPTNIPLTDGTGLTQAFLASMNENLANWPKGPALNDPFWLLMALWHVGLFACLIFGTIGANLNRVEKP